MTVRLLLLFFLIWLLITGGLIPSLGFIVTLCCYVVALPVSIALLIAGYVSHRRSLWLPGVALLLSVLVASKTERIIRQHQIRLTFQQGTSIVETVDGHKKDQGVYPQELWELVPA